MLSPLGWLDALLATMRRECVKWTESRGEVIFCSIMPVFWILVIWGLLGQGVISRVPVGFVDEDKSTMSREVERAIAVNRAFGLITYEDRATAMADMRQGALYGIVAIPFAYSRDMLRGAGSSIVLYVDENRYAVAGTLQAEMASIVDALSNERLFNLSLQVGDGTAGASRMVSVVHSEIFALGNMQYSFLAFLGAALIPGVIMVGAMMAFVTCILREDWHNSMAEWRDCANGSPSAAITGKIIPHFAFYCLLILFYIAIFCGEGGFPAAGSLFLWFVCGVCCLAVFAAMAVLVVSLAPSWRVALVFTAGYSAPALPFTGFSIPLDSMTPFVKVFAKCLPLTWFIQGQSQQWTLGADLAHTGHTFLALAILFAVPACLGYPFFRRRFLEGGLKNTGFGR